MGTAKKILIVEDDYDIREALAELLSDMGHHVAIATNGADALAVLAKDACFDVIVLDLMMPVMDGASFRATQLERGGDLARIPVVVLTAQRRSADELADLHPAATLRKPVGADELGAVLDGIPAAARC